MGAGMIARDQHITARTLPPPMFRMVPVQKLAVARYSTASATSSGSPNRASGTPLVASSRCSAVLVSVPNSRALLHQHLDQRRPGHARRDHIHADAIGSQLACKHFGEAVGGGLGL